MVALSVIGLAYSAVLLAEIVGDRSMYTIAMLRLRFRSPFIYAGVAAAFASKMGVAVVLGSVLVKIPLRWSSIVTGIVLLGASAAVWRGEEKGERSDVCPHPRSSHATMMAFASLFFSEWADPGQMTAAAIAGETHIPVATWVGATLALFTKGIIAVLIASLIGTRFTIDRMRPVSATFLAAMGLSALAGIWT
jgi:Ca2+/H+ antiporter, TMEM165/GDT1 family